MINGDAVSNFTGGKGGDNGGGDSITPGDGDSTSLLLPLSTFVKALSSDVSLAASDSTPEFEVPAALRWISLKRWAMRSETVAERCGCVALSRDKRRGEVV
jgi:hypothetical protein